MTTHIGLAPRRLEQRRDDPHRRRFARTVGTDKAEQIAGSQIELDPLDREQVAILLCEIERLDHGPFPEKGEAMVSGRSTGNRRRTIVTRWS